MRSIVFFILIFLFLLLLPVFRILFGPFGSFVWHIGSFWNSTNIILLQNEAELRPSGGFLSAVGILEIKNGVPHISILDSYSIANPPESIRAPSAIEEIFSEDPRYSGWVFRDANFSPDFPKSAKNVLQFLQYDPRFSEKKIDTVVAVNFETVRNLLKKFGPIGNFSEDNLFQILQRKTKDIDLHSQEDLDNRKDSLGDLADRLLNKIGYFGLPSALDSFADSAKNKDVQIWFSDPMLQKIILEKGWDGSLPLENFFSVNVANLGAKKSDRYMFKHYFSDISISSDGKMNEDLTVEFHHRGGENLYSGPGFYFIRIYRPYGTVLSGDSPGWSQKTTIGQMEEFSKMIFLHSSETTSESVSFLLPDPWTIGNRSFYWSAQSGSMDELMMTIHHEGDASFTAKGCEKEYSHENVLFCFSSLDSDRVFDVQMHPDTFSPILENISFENNREIAIRFSEPVSASIADSTLLIRCKDKEYSPSKIFRNDAYPRDVRIVLSERVEFDGEFCALEWKGVSDEFQNTTDLSLTLPFRK